MSLRSLGGDVPPPPHLKSRVVRDLRARGVVARRSRAWLAAAALAGLTLFGAGYVAGRGRAPEPAPGLLPRYALLLYEDEAFDRTRPEPALVSEYGAWARRLEAAGRFAGGEKLGVTAGVEPAAGATGLGVLTGFFLLSVPDDSTALALARESPHRRYGGRVVVRRVDPT